MRFIVDAAGSAARVQQLDLRLPANTIRTLVASMAGWLTTLSAGASPRAEYGRGRHRIVVTPAEDSAGPGLRAYPAVRPLRDTSHDATLVYQPGTGRLEGIFVGPSLGRLRTALIAGVALGALSRCITRAAIIGCGGQAAMQARILAAMHPRCRLKVHCRTPSARDEFAADAATLFQFPVQSCASVEEAVQEADVIIMATSSTVPVLEARDVAGCPLLLHIGPKRDSASDVAPEIYRQAQILVTDAPAQLRHGWPTSVLSQAAIGPDAVHSLAQWIDTRVPAPSLTEGLAIFHSLGLAGTEVMLARALLAAPDGELFIPPTTGTLHPLH